MKFLQIKYGWPFNAKWKDIIVAVGETKAEKDGGVQKEVVERDVFGKVADLTPDEISRLIIAYEPRWAIGKVAASAQDAQEMAAFIRAVIRFKYGSRVADGLRILYGDQRMAVIAASFLSQPDIDGLLVGGKSLNVETFKLILDAVQSVYKHGMVHMSLQIGKQMTL